MMERLVVDDITHWARTYKVWPLPVDSPCIPVFLHFVKHKGDTTAEAE